MSAESPKVASKAAQPSQSRPQLPASCDPPGDGNPPKQAVWVIFGATGQMGRSLVHSGLAHGDLVTAVGRTFEHSPEQMQGWHENCFGMLCDVRVRETVDEVFKKTLEKFGRIDVIANCTGYGIISPAEDQSPHDLYDQFATNFLGTLHILQLSLPYFREKDLHDSKKSPENATSGKRRRRSSNAADSEDASSELKGRYLIFSSTAGALGVPGMASYCATKYAVEGLIESMLYEVHCFGIKATLVEPGHMRDDDDAKFASETATQTSAQARSVPISPPITRNGNDQSRTRKRFAHFHIHPNPSAPYRNPNSPSMHALRTMQWLDNRQQVSTQRSAELCWQLAHCNYPPLRLLLGSYAVDSIRDRLRCVTEEIEDWKFLSFGPAPISGPAVTNLLGSAHEERPDGRERAYSTASLHEQQGQLGEHEEDYEDDENAEYDNDYHEADYDEAIEEDSEENNDHEGRTSPAPGSRPDTMDATIDTHGDVPIEDAHRDQGWDDNQMPVVYHAMQG